MAKQVRMMRPTQAEFQKVFSKLCHSASAWQVWNDFVEMTAISISNTIEVRADVKEQREKIYLNTIKKYKKDDQALFPELVAILAEALEVNPDQDFLGELFMALELGSNWHGQFFTPYSICRMMADVSLEGAEEKIAEQGYVSINDPACGAGATLIAARNALLLRRFGSSETFFVGQDISRVAGLMCYIQLSLLGCAGYVVIANTLTQPVTGPLLRPSLTPEQDAWFMPCTYLDSAWVLRMMGRTVKRPQAGTKPPAPPEIPLKEAEDGQMILF